MSIVQQINSHSNDINVITACDVLAISLRYKYIHTMLSARNQSHLQLVIWKMYEMLMPTVPKLATDFLVVSLSPSYCGDSFNLMISRAAFFSKWN